MDVNVNVTLNASPSLLEAVRLLAGANFGAPKMETLTVLEDIAPASTTASKRTRATVVPKKDEPTAQVNIEEKVEKAEEATTASDEPITLETIRQVTGEKARLGKRDEIQALLSEFDVKNLTAINPDDYPAFIKKMAVI